MNYLITGSTSKIGLILISKLLDNGNSVHAVFRNNNKTLNKLLLKNKGKLFLHKVDLSKEVQINNLFIKFKKNKIFINSFVSLAAIRENIKYHKLEISSILLTIIFFSFKSIETINELLIGTRYVFSR